MKTVQRKENMASDNKLRDWAAARCVSGEGIVAGHMRMNHFNFVLLYKASQVSCAGCVERIAQWERFYIRDRHPQMCEQGRLRPDCHIKIMTAGDEGIRKVSQIALAAAKG